MPLISSSPSDRITRILFPRNQNVQNNGTGREEVISWIGQVHYGENLTPCQNFVRFVINGGELPSAEMTIRGWDISLEGKNSQELHFPQHVRLEQACRLVSAGIITFYQGVLCGSVHDEQL